MRSLAAVLHEAGWRVTGSDCTAIAPGDYAFPVFSPHARQNVPEGIHYLIHSDAVQCQNSELTGAAEKGVPRKSYFQTLGDLMVGRIGVAVAGTHGKSTVTAMTAQCLINAGLDPTVVYGAAPLHATHGGRLGHGPIVLVEACEYRRNFLNLTPRYGVVLGVEPDHFDCFPSQKDLDDAFGEFVESIADGGFLLVRHECPRARQAALSARCPTETCGFAPGADWHAVIRDVDHGHYTLSLNHRHRQVITVRLCVPGRHQAINAAAAAALSIRLGAPPAAVENALSRFDGLRRRLQRIDCVNSVVFLDDFAHHPTEIDVTLATIREMDPNRRLVCIFQPHQAGRTAALLDEMALSLDNVDRLALMEIFRAREGPARPGDVTSADLAAAIRSNGGTVDAVLEEDGLTEYLRTTLRPGDWLLAMGAGDIGRKLHEALRRLKHERSAR